MSATANSCGRARLALLLAGTAAIALLAGNAAHAITINDQTAQQFPPLGFVGSPPFAPVGTLPNYWDMNNAYSNVGNVNFNFDNGGGCTGTLINSRTVLTAAHCFIGLLNNQPDRYTGGATRSAFPWFESYQATSASL
jgi:hypothetical protein